MVAAVFGQRDFAASASRAQIVQPRVFHDAKHPAGEIRAGPKLIEMAPRALHRGLHEIVGIVLVARQRTREASQPRQQQGDAFTDFLRRITHGFMLDNTSGEEIFFRAYPRLYSRGLAGDSGLGTGVLAAGGRAGSSSARAASGRGPPRPNLRHAYPGAHAACGAATPRTP